MEPLPPRPFRVLVVDDCADTSASLAMLLRAWGYTADIAHSGPEALRLAAEAPPGAVSLDIGLPGMSGWELARQLRQMPTLKKALLVAVSGYGQPEDCRRSREAGCDLHLLKPVQPELLRCLLSLRQKENLANEPRTVGAFAGPVGDSGGSGGGDR
jgi:two-component system CheB/CheR fusion protein